MKYGIIAAALPLALVLAGCGEDDVSTTLDAAVPRAERCAIYEVGRTMPAPTGMAMAGLYIAAECGEQAEGVDLCSAAAIVAGPSADIVRARYGDDMVAAAEAFLLTCPE